MSKQSEIENFKVVCSCGCPHVRGWIDGDILKIEFESSDPIGCGCPPWARHIVTTEERESKSLKCNGTMAYGEDCGEETNEGGKYCSGHLQALLWEYLPHRAYESRGNMEDATERQIDYIKFLADKSPKEFHQLMSAINAFLYEKKDLSGLVKGEASWIIQTLKDLRSKKPKKED